MRFSKTAIIAAVSVLTPLLGHADTVKSDPTLSIANLTFNDFSCNVSKGGFANPVGCGQIDVSTITHPGTGIQFSSGFTALGFGFDDAIINYHVGSTSGIDHVGLDFNGTFYGYAISSVTENIFDSNGDQVGMAKVSCGAFAGCSQTDSIALNGSYDNLYITKDINVSAFLGVAQISYIDQTFNATATPEPSSIALLGSGLLAAGAGIMRRRKAAAVKA